MSEPGLTFHSPDAQRRARASFLMWSAVPVLMCLMSLSSGQGVGGMILPAVIIAIAALRSWRIRQSSVSIYPDRLVVRNIWRTSAIPWSNISQIGVHLTAPPEDLLRGALGLPADEESINAIPEHRRIYDESDGVTKFLLALYINTPKRRINIDSPTADLVEALAVAWAAAKESRQLLVPDASREWEKVISSAELSEWFSKEAPPRKH